MSTIDNIPFIRCASPKYGVISNDDLENRVANAKKLPEELMSKIKRVDGQNCHGCYNLKQWRDVYYCRSYALEDGVHYQDQLGFHVVKFWNRVITDDEINCNERPSWCPLERV